MNRHNYFSPRIALAWVGLACMIISSFATGTAVHAAQISTVTITSDNDDAHEGDTITFTAWVACAGVIPTGTVSFYDNTSLIGTQDTQDGVAAISEIPSQGSHFIEAVYSGDANCAPSRGAISQIIGGSTNTTVSASPNPATTTQTVTLTAQIIALGACTLNASDTVTFTDGVFTTPSTLSISGSGKTGTASVSGTFSAGIHNIQAAYNDNGHSCGASSGTITLTITAASGSIGTTSVTPSCPTGYPILGSVIVSKSQSAFDKPNGNEIVDANNRKVVLPNPDFPGPAVYSVITEQTVSGTLWYGLFVGGCNPVWVPASGVTVKDALTF